MKNDKEKKTKQSSSSKEDVMEVESKSAVTGGAPEDINMMPPDVDPGSDDPVYDGSDAESKDSKS